MSNANRERAMKVAQICHAANRELQIVSQQGEVSLPWDQAPEWQKSSAWLGVVAAWEGKTPEELHILWCKEKKKDGWIYGPIKDAESKTHPCLVPYSQLPPHERLKDHVFNAIVNAHKEFLGENK